MLLTVVMAGLVGFAAVLAALALVVLVVLAADVRRSDKAAFARLAAAKLPVAVLGSTA